MKRQLLHMVPFAALLALGAVLPTALRGQRSTPPQRVATAVFAGGCFWSVEHAFEEIAGIVSITVGYTGGHVVHPTYEDVSTGGTGHLESVQILYDPSKIDYERLLGVFWHTIDPLDPDGQVCDHGPEYHTAIFYRDSTQRRLAEESKRRLEGSGRFKQPIVTEIVPAGAFYPAEEYHQHYARKNPVRYELYRVGCGRDRRLKELWGTAAPQAEAQR